MIFLTHLGLGFPSEPNSSSMRIAFLSLTIYGFLIINMYEAMFAAMLAIEVIRPPVQNIEGIKNFPNKLTLSNGSSIHKLFLNANKDSIYHQLLQNGKIKPTEDKDKKWIEKAVQGTRFISKQIFLDQKSFSLVPLCLLLFWTLFNFFVIFIVQCHYRAQRHL